MLAGAARAIAYASLLLWGIGVPLSAAVMVIYFQVGGGCCVAMLFVGVSLRACGCHLPWHAASQLASDSL